MVMKRVAYFSFALLLACFSCNPSTTEAPSEYHSTEGSEIDVTSSDPDLFLKIPSGFEVAIEPYREHPLGFLPLGATVDVEVRPFLTENGRTRHYLAFYEFFRIDFGPETTVVKDTNDIIATVFSPQYKYHDVSHFSYSIKVEKKVSSIKAHISYIEPFEWDIEIPVCDVASSMTSYYLDKDARYSPLNTGVDYPRNFFVERANSRSELIDIARKWCVSKLPKFDDSVFEDNYVAVAFLYVDPDRSLRFDSSYDYDGAFNAVFIQEIPPSYFIDELMIMRSRNIGICYFTIRRDLGYNEYLFKCIEVPLPE